MPFRTKAMLDSWLEEFRALGYPLSDEFRVLLQDSEGGANAGLVTLTLAGPGTQATIQPRTQGDTGWVVTFEARDEPVDVTAAGVARLGSELVTVSALCAFLEAKSQTLTAAGGDVATPPTPDA